MFNKAEHNYNIHDQELLAMFWGLTHWHHLLLSSPFEVMVLTDHKNLEYYKEPHHINRRIAWYVQCMQDYNFIIKHISGDSNKSDVLSWWPDYNKEFMTTHMSLSSCHSYLYKLPPYPAYSHEQPPCPPLMNEFELINHNSQNYSTSGQPHIT